MSVHDRPLRVALLAYRGNPRSGGQGVYVRHLAAALRRLGHDVEVLAGPPYPELDPDIPMTPLPSLDLYAEDGLGVFRPKRVPRGAVDLLELGAMCAASFPEPLTFSLRARRVLRDRLADFDVVHDNQCLGYGLLGLAEMGLPVVATIHHPITIDRDVELHHAPTLRRKLLLRRWYAFTRMQGRVARRLPRILTVSEASKTDIVKAFGVSAQRISVVPNGVDPDLFRPLPDIDRVRGRLVTTASADVPLKGLPVLVEALAKLRTEHPDAHVVVVGRPGPPDGPTRRAVERFGIEDAVEFRGGIDTLDLVELYATAEAAVVPSLYEGFSLPAIEAMACGVPLVTTDGGALPEVTGRDGETARVVPAGDAGTLSAAIKELLGDPGLRERLGRAGRDRVLERFTWKASARRTVQHYRSVVDPAGRGC